MSDVLIVGCGYVGTALGRQLAAQGHVVWGLRRDPEAARALEAAGIRPVIADVTNPESLTDLPAADWVIACVSAGIRGNYQAIYADGARHVLAALKTTPQRMIWISSTGVYEQTDGSWVDERTPLSPKSERSRLLLEAERIVLAGVAPAMILRLGGIYGPGRDMLHRLREGKADTSLTYVNLIHRDDIVGLLQWLLERGQPGETYLGVDDAPSRRVDVYGWLARRAGIPLPRTAVPDRYRLPTSKRCSNRKIKALGYRFLYPDFRQGLGALHPEH